MLLGGIKFLPLLLGQVLLLVARSPPVPLHSVPMLWDCPPIPVGLVSLLYALEYLVGICKISLVNVAICVILQYLLHVQFLDALHRKMWAGQLESKQSRSVSPAKTYPESESLRLCLRRTLSCREVMIFIWLVFPRCLYVMQFKSMVKSNG